MASGAPAQLGEIRVELCHPTLRLHCPSVSQHSLADAALPLPPEGGDQCGGVLGLVRGHGLGSDVGREHIHGQGRIVPCARRVRDGCACQLGAGAAQVGDGREQSPFGSCGPLSCGRVGASQGLGLGRVVGECADPIALDLSGAGAHIGEQGPQADHVQFGGVRPDSDRPHAFGQHEVAPTGLEQLALEPGRPLVGRREVTGLLLKGLRGALEAEGRRGEPGACPGHVRQVGRGGGLDAVQPCLQAGHQGGAVLGVRPGTLFDSGLGVLKLLGGAGGVRGDTPEREHLGGGGSAQGAQCATPDEPADRRPGDECDAQVREMLPCQRQHLCSSPYVGDTHP